MITAHRTPSRHLGQLDFRRLVRMLVAEFDDVLGPVRRDGVIRLDRIDGPDDLVVDVIDDQEAGWYRTIDVDGVGHFSHGPAADSLKATVSPPRRLVWTMRRRDGGLTVEPAARSTPRTAVIGARACDIRAMSTLARTQLDGDHPDEDVARRRDALFIVAVDCSRPAATCFCTSAGGGPAARSGFDVALAEIVRPGSAASEYVARTGSSRGVELLDRLGLAPASAADEARAAEVVRRAEMQFVRELPADARQAVADPSHPRWDELAERCLTCGNCTAVCPTCFCTDVDDVVSLDGETATRHRVWDTCFSMEYSSLGGRPHRASPRSRYRQWLTHKLGTWHEQFDESGCVGCGRCITWCPVGIDLTAEVEALGRPAEDSP